MLDFVIGTANFGQNYGTLKNKFLIKNKKKLSTFLTKNKIEYFDCALNYKYHNKNLKIIQNHNFKVISKVKLPKTKKKLFLDNLDKILNKNLKLLKKDKYDLMLLHEVGDLDKANGKKLLKKLFEIKKQKIIKNIGVSVYKKVQITKVLKKFKPHTIQLPYNVLNLNEFDDDFLKSLKKKNIKLQARSIFFQGLLLQNEKKINKLMIKKNIKDILIKFFFFLKSNKLSNLEYCVNIIKKNKNFESVTLGINNFDELKKIIKLFKKESNKLNFTLLNFDNKKIFDTRKINKNEK